MPTAWCWGCYCWCWEMCWKHFGADLSLRYIFVHTWAQGLVKILKLMFGQYFAADVRLRLWSWCLVEILKMKFVQDLCRNSWFELNPRVRCVLAMFFFSLVTTNLVVVQTLLLFLFLLATWSPKRENWNWNTKSMDNGGLGEQALWPEFQANLYFD